MEEEEKGGRERDGGREGGMDGADERREDRFTTSVYGGAHLQFTDLVR